MTENVSNLILEHLKALRGDTAAIRENLFTLTQRVSSIETQVANLHADMALVHRRIDTLDERVGRIETRLDLRSH